MKKLSLIFGLAVAMMSCSTCYECSEEVIIYSGSTPTDTSITTEELCTADASVITEREAAGADCKSI
ncbi:MAG: hypothetical protein KC456_10415 [Flavobacteriales bacterium]|jgi:hypothetical protein|nr:hypothetical protein [Flavobacteriales bacterium]